MGYATKDSDPDFLLAAIRKLVAGGRFIDPKLADAMIFEVTSGDTSPHETLSDREFQVLEMLADGKSINDIAETLTRSVKTIGTHRMRLLKKLRVDNDAQMIRYAIDHGIVSE
jgi:DNA-binding NarL/FixJ family response regulator